MEQLTVWTYTFTLKRPHTPEQIIYVGSTMWDMSQRMRKHKSYFNNEEINKKLYKFMKEKKYNF